MSFRRHGEIYRPMNSSGITLGRSSPDRPQPHRYDEFPTGYSLASCAPAEPVSASPARAHLAAMEDGGTIETQRTANSVLTACLTQGDNPTYSPEFNPTERLWQYTRRTGTHNRYFSHPSELLATLTRVFTEMQSHPELIRPYLASFCCLLSKICGLIPVPVVVPACDKAPFPSRRRFGIRRIVWSPLESCC
jgi:hypothetical protein